MPATSIRVMVRARPLTGKQSGEKVALTALPGSNECVIAGRTFTFDQVFSSSATQETVFQAIGVDTIDHLLKGYNTTILAYGQTGSGKTHTMIGPNGGNLSQQVGLIPKLLNSLFTKVRAMNPKETSVTISLQAFELYKEVVSDLFSPNSPLDFKIREDIINGKGIYVENLATVVVADEATALVNIQKCIQQRHVSATKANETSSRSHSIFVVNIEQINHINDGTKITSKLNLVDLAGSEKVSITEAAGERLKEAQMINLSLTLLGNVIYKLTDGKSVHIPYRDSKLTRILQDSLGGNALTTLLCCCSPAAEYQNETLSTLAFALRAKQIHNKPKVNATLTPQELTLAYARAQEEITLLREQVELLKRGAPGVAGSTEDGLGSTEAHIQSLLQQIDESRSDLYESLQQNERLNKQLQFYLTKNNEMEASVTDLRAALEREKKASFMWQQQLGDAQRSRKFSSASVKKAPTVPAPRTTTTFQGSAVTLLKERRGQTGQVSPRKDADTSTASTDWSLTSNSMSSVSGSDSLRNSGTMELLQREKEKYGEALLREAELQSDLDDRKAEVSKLQNALKEERVRAKQNTDSLEHLNGQLEGKNEEIELLRKQLEAKTIELDNIQNEMGQASQWNSELKSQLNTKNEIKMEDWKDLNQVDTFIQSTAMNCLILTEQIYESENNLYMIESNCYGTALSITADQVTSALLEIEREVSDKIARLRNCLTCIQELAKTSEAGAIEVASLQERIRILIEKHREHLSTLTSLFHRANNPRRSGTKRF